MSNVAISVESVGKKYRLGGNVQPYRTLRESLSDVATTPFRTASRLVRRRSALARARPDFWAVKDVSFEVDHGEVLGIIGRNGAGKSTLLKLLSQITEPTEGRIRMKGRVASLLEVGTGFHPELTGRENVFLNGAILGMSRVDIAHKFDEIVAFSEVEKFIDTQVKHYSSGMHLRLAFAVAAHLEPEILVVDEVLAVGDAQFQKKCLGKMEDVSRSGRTVLFVSHQMLAVEHLCSRAMVLDKGTVAFEGRVSRAIDHYMEQVRETLGQTSLLERTDRSGSGRVRLIGFHLEDGQGNVIPAARCGQDLCLALTFAASEEAQQVNVGVAFHDNTDRALAVFYTDYVDQTFASIPHTGVFRCIIPKLPLVAGRYKVGARVVERGVEADWLRDGVSLMDVDEGDFYGTGRKGFDGSSVLMLNGQWSLSEQ